jgi:hypothetical protein
MMSSFRMSGFAPPTERASVPRVVATVGASVVIESCGSFARFAPQDDVGRRFIIRSDIQQTMRVKWRTRGRGGVGRLARDLDAGAPALS